VVYFVGFSLAYLRLDAGLGALILFATVQLGLFAWVLRGPDPVGSRPVAGMVLAMVPLILLGPDREARGLALAVVSGALASGLGYAVGYAVLSGLGTMQAGVAQLSVPVLAILGGAVLLGEAITAQILMASALGLGGIGLSVLGRSQRRMGSSGS
jgi:drug/metabolite transporter (DMT)-like permease